MIRKKVVVKRSKWLGLVQRNRALCPYGSSVSKQPYKFRDSRIVPIIIVLISVLFVSLIPLTSLAASKGPSSAWTHSNSPNSTEETTDLHLHIFWIGKYSNNIDPNSLMNSQSSVHSPQSSSSTSEIVDLHLHLFWMVQT